MDASTQPDTVTTVIKPKFFIKNIQFDAFVRFPGAEHNLVGHEYRLDKETIGTNTNALISALKSWKDGRCFDTNSMIIRRASYSISDMTITWGFFDTAIEMSTRPCSVKTTTVVDSGMSTYTYDRIKMIKTEGDIELFHRRIDYLISVLENFI